MTLIYQWINIPVAEQYRNSAQTLFTVEKHCISFLLCTTLCRLQAWSYRWATPRRVSFTLRWPKSRVGLSLVLIRDIYRRTYAGLFRDLTRPIFDRSTIRGSRSQSRSEWHSIAFGRSLERRIDWAIRDVGTPFYTIPGGFSRIRAQAIKVGVRSNSLVWESRKHSTPCTWKST